MESGDSYSGEDTLEMMVDCSSRRMLVRLQEYDKQHGTSLYKGSHDQFIEISGMFEDGREENQILLILTINGKATCLDDGYRYDEKAMDPLVRSALENQKGTNIQYSEYERLKALKRNDF